MKITGRCVTALVLSLTLMLGCVGFVYADNSGKKTIEAAEAPAETILPSDTVSDDEAVYVLTDAAGTVEKIIVNDRIKAANGTETSLQTGEQKDLPVNVRFTYKLDGQEIAPTELAGRSGRVEIRIDYTNNARAVEEINGQEEQLYVPFLALSALLLDDEHYTNVTVENAKMLNDGTRTVVVGYALPGMNENLALPEDLGLTIPDHVTVRADVKDCALGSVYTLVANNLFKDYDGNDPDALKKLISSMSELTASMDLLLNGAQELNDGLDLLLAKSGSLTNGVSSLCNGADQVAGGAGTLKAGAEQLAAGTTDVKNGAEQLAAGAGNLKAGADQLAGGADQLSTGLNQISANSAAINEGADRVFMSLLSAAENQLKAAGLSSPALTVANYQDVLNQVIAALGSDSPAAQSVAALRASLDQYYAFYLGIKSYTAGVDAAAGGAQDLSSGAAQVKAGAASLADGSAALAAGTKNLSEGAAALSSGAATLSDGTNQLAAGAHTLKDNLPALIDGIKKLRDGSDALHSGMEQFNEKGIQKLSQLVTVDAEGFAERLKAIASLGKEYHSAYTGLSDDTEGELRFIYRTAAIGE